MRGGKKSQKPQTQTRRLGHPSAVLPEVDAAGAAAGSEPAAIVAVGDGVKITKAIHVEPAEHDQIFHIPKRNKGVRAGTQGPIGAGKDRSIWFKCQHASVTKVFFKGGFRSRGFQIPNTNTAMMGRLGVEVMGSTRCE